MKPNRQIVAWLRIEGAALLLAATLYYQHLAGNWWLFAALLLAVDISMLGYLKNPRIGAFFYNAGHSIVIPVVLFIFLHNNQLASQLVIIWLAHVGMDRLFGYGLKYPDNFEHTHLGIIGKYKKR